mmetsp:Transcript_15666/g.28115  ORF Transcript_15666/g.28115 Transcript_15666/m.28115 type:complete len:335 (+) Transcript_15666:779-1783(+)
MAGCSGRCSSDVGWLQGGRGSGGRGSGGSSDGDGGCGSGGGSGSGSSSSPLDVRDGNAAVGSRTSHSLQVHAELLRPGLGERRRNDASVGSRLRCSSRRGGGCGYGRLDCRSRRSSGGSGSSRRSGLGSRSDGWRWLGGGWGSCGSGCGAACLGLGLGDFVFGVDKVTNGIADACRSSFRHDDGGQNAFVEGFDVHVSLVGLDNRNTLTFRHFVAFRFKPAHDLSLSHCRAQCRHENILNSIRSTHPPRGHHSAESHGAFGFHSRLVHSCRHTELDLASLHPAHHDENRYGCNTEDYSGVGPCGALGENGAISAPERTRAGVEGCIRLHSFSHV